MSAPNILLVMADQLAPHFTGVDGHPLVQTPALEALAERGAHFDAAGSATRVSPVSRERCGDPARASRRRGVQSQPSW